MDSDDSRDGGGDVRSSSSSSSSSSRSRRSSSSDGSEPSKKDAKSPPLSPKSPRSDGPHSPSPDSSRSPTSRSALRGKAHSLENLSEVHSDINSPENSMPASPMGPKSPEGPKSPSDAGSNIDSPGRSDQCVPLSGQGPGRSARSPVCSPENRSRPSDDSTSQQTSPHLRNARARSQTSSPSPSRNSNQSSPARSPKKSSWSPKENWRRHTKAEQKMVPVSSNRSGSESSQSSRSSSYNKRNSKNPATEEISEGEMESEGEERKSRLKLTTSNKMDGKDLNLSHEDLSDVSDLDSVGPDDNDKEPKPITSLASPENRVETINGTISSSPKQDIIKGEISKLEKVPPEKTSNTEAGEEQLDFEAEEGECVEPKESKKTNGEAEDKRPETGEVVKPGRVSRGSSLEEGEVSDEAERRPEETEPRPVCRFFSRGACTWGVSCRFLHPGVTDKGNYNMFEVIRGVPPSGSYSTAPPRDTAPPESAWERGLRTAKEMLRIANKRKEQDMDFEEKKLHLSVGGVVHDPDAELAYAAAAVGASPPRNEPLAPHGAHGPVGPHGPHAPLVREREREREPELRAYGPGYRARFPVRPGFEERDRMFERERMYERERIYERPPVYDERLAVTEEGAYHKRRLRASREVIVQRAEGERDRERERERDRERERWERGAAREGGTRGEAWADPWMRQEPTARRRRPPSTDESYSSTSSRSSRSPGARRKRRASSSSRQRLSPSVIVRERRLATARATAMNPPAPRRRAPSPAAARQMAVNPPPPQSSHPHRHKDELDPYGRKESRSRDRKQYSRSSTSGSESSSSSSESESESRSSASSSTGSSGARRARHARLLNAAHRPRLNTKTGAAGLAATVSTLTGKKEAPLEKETASRKRSANSPVDTGPSKKSVSRREELLKQLKAVEDAIARKRSKI